MWFYGGERLGANSKCIKYTMYEHLSNLTNTDISFHYTTKAGKRQEKSNRKSPAKKSEIKCI